MASFTGGVMASRFPVITADAIAPLSPGKTARMRWSIASRIPSTTVAYRSQRLGACGISATRIRPSTKPEAPIRLKYMSRAKSYPPGRNGSSGGDSRALNSTNVPTAGAVPLRTETRTRSSVSSSREPAMRSIRTTMRSERSRSSRISTKPAISTFQTGADSTGCAMIARLMVAVANPAARAAAPNAKGNAKGRRRARTVAAAVAASRRPAAHGAGSRSMAK